MDSITLAAAYFRGRAQTFIKEVQGPKKPVENARERKLEKENKELKKEIDALKDVINRGYTGQYWAISTAAHIRTRDILLIVSKYYNISIKDICSPRRTMDVLEPRHVTMYLAKEVTMKSLPEIGRAIGGRDHTSVLHAVRKMKAAILINPQLAEKIKELRTKIAELMTPPTIPAISDATAVAPMAEAPVIAPEQAGASNG